MNFNARTLARIATASAFALSSVSFANGVPLLVKTNSPGFVMPQTAASDTCRVYADRVEIARNVGDLQSMETKQMTTDAAPLLKLIEEARAGNITRTRGPVDGPITQWYGFLTQGANTSRVMFASFGTGNNEENDSLAAVQLRIFLDQVCGTATLSGQ